MRWKAIILAAGRGTRMGDITKTTSKCLLEIGNKSILEWTLESISKIPEFKEIIICVDWKKDLIKKKIGHNFKGKPIKYINIPHFPKENIEKEFQTNSFGMNFHIFSQKRNYLEYIEAIINCAFIDNDLENTDFYWRFNGDVLNDYNSINKFAQIIRKNRLSASGTIISAYSSFLIKVLKEMKDYDWRKMIKFEGDLYGLTVFHRKYPKRINRLELYTQIIQNLPHNSKIKRDIEREISQNPIALKKKIEYINQSDFKEAINIGDHLHKHRHIDTTKDLIRIRSGFKQ